MVETFVVLLKIAAVGFLAFGAYVCVAKRDRRVGRSPAVELKRRRTDLDRGTPAVVHIADARTYTDFSIGFRSVPPTDKLAA